MIKSVCFGMAIIGAFVSMIIYLDRKELERFPTVPEFRTPLYMVIDLAILEKEAAQAVSPMDMVIKNVTAYQLR